MIEQPNDINGSSFFNSKQHYYIPVASHSHDCVSLRKSALSAGDHAVQADIHV